MWSLKNDELVLVFGWVSRWAVQVAVNRTCLPAITQREMSVQHMDNSQTINLCNYVHSKGAMDKYLYTIFDIFSNPKLSTEIYTRKKTIGE